MTVVYLCHPLGTWTTFYDKWFEDWRTEAPPCSYCNTSIWIVPNTLAF